jgi:hypothetical protein
MSLSQHVYIAPRYQRAVRIDADLGNAAALEGFVCTGTFQRALTTVADQLAQTRQGAYTWTGPYGGGKSSLILALAGLLGPKGAVREKARAVLGAPTSERLTQAFRPGPAGWRVVPIVGARRDAASVIWQGLVDAGAVRTEPKRLTSEHVIDTLMSIARRPAHSGLLLVIDELGKLLEHAASGDGDLHLFQELAERASRSDGRLVVIGVLHQSFDEYANRLGRHVRDEWSKVQGRFLDVPLQVTGLEQLEILGRAIQGKPSDDRIAGLVDKVAAALHRYRPDTPGMIDRQLLRCWPLHPITACLLGPISRRRFAQNQRSLFAFLNSHEPGGFQEFLAHGQTSDLYTADKLFDHLRLNLEASILASPDGHRWALAVDAVERAQQRDADAQDLVLLKTIALVDLFRDRSGLFATEEVMRTAIPGIGAKPLRERLARLRAWSVVTYREHMSSYSIYAGSDFDLQAALEVAAEQVGPIDIGRLKQVANLRPVVAKRHYHTHGTLRWFDVDVVALNDLDRRVADLAPSAAMGQFLLVVPQPDDSDRDARHRVAVAATKATTPLGLGLFLSSRRLYELAQKALALEHVRSHRSELAGDPVARREVEARAAQCANELESEVRRAFAGAEWTVGGLRREDVGGLAGLTRIASELADSVYVDAPRLFNELLNRTTPGSNAIAAQKTLLKAMVSNPATPRLGIEGFPAEGGLYESLLVRTGLHRVDTTGAVRFQKPPRTDPAHLTPLWKATDEFLKRAATTPISAAELYALWRAPPFGVREGLRPVLLIAYLQSRAARYTVYLNGQLEVALTDLTIDRLTSNPSALSVRAFDAGDRARRLFAELGSIVEATSSAPTLDPDDTVALAKAVVGLVKAQPAFVHRTQRLSPAALAVRAAIRAATDPHILLHESLPATLDDLVGCTPAPIDAAVSVLRDALNELSEAYGSTLNALDATLRRELDVEGVPDLAALRERATCISGLTGDFRVEAFITRMSAYTASRPDIEGIASLATSKPPRDWSDADVDRAHLEIASLAQQFNRAEAFARVKGRSDGRHAIAFVVGLDRTPGLQAREFEIPERDRRTVLELARALQGVLAGSSSSPEVRLAALAHVGSVLMEKAS